MWVLSGSPLQSVTPILEGVFVIPECDTMAMATLPPADQPCVSRAGARVLALPAAMASVSQAQRLPAGLSRDAQRLSVMLATFDTLIQLCDSSGAASVAGANTHDV